MQLKLFNLLVKNLSAPEAEVNAFMCSNRVLVVKKEFVSDGGEFGVTIVGQEARVLERVVAHHFP